MDRKRAAESAVDAACQAEETPKIFRFISPPSVTPEKAKKPRWDEGGESEPKAKEKGIGEEAKADKDNDCVKDEDNSEDEECSDRATGNSMMGFGRHARLAYREVMTDHYDYVVWVKAHAGDATGRLQNFLEWMESLEGESFPARITFGMHNGKSFQKWQSKIHPTIVDTRQRIQNVINWTITSGTSIGTGINVLQTRVKWLI